MGTNKTAALNHTRLIPARPPRGRTETKLELKRILGGKGPRPPLEDGDIIFVPSSFSKTRPIAASKRL